MKVSAASHRENGTGEHEMGITEEKIRRINELARKSKAEGLTEREKVEQAALRAEYIAAFRRNLKSQLDNIDIKEADGTIVNLGEKYGNRSGNGKKGN